MKVTTFLILVLTSLAGFGCGRIYAENGGTGTGGEGGTAFAPACPGNWETLSLPTTNGNAGYTGGVGQYAYGELFAGGSNGGVIVDVDPSSHALGFLFDAASEFMRVDHMAKLASGDVVALGPGKGDASKLLISVQGWQHLPNVPMNAYDVCGTSLEDYFLLRDRSQGGNWSVSHVSNSDPYQIDLGSGDVVYAFSCIGDSVFVSIHDWLAHQSYGNARLFQLTNGSLAQIPLKPGTREVYSVVGTNPHALVISYRDNALVGHLATLVDGVFQNDVTNDFGENASAYVENLRLVGNQVAGTFYAYDVSNGVNKEYGNAVFFDAALVTVTQNLAPWLTRASGIWQGDDGMVYAAGIGAANALDVAMCAP